MLPLLSSEIYTMKCEHCKDELTIQEGTKLVPCPYCMTAERLIASLKRAIADSKKEKKKELAEHLQAVLNFLPEYPVMAMMEAEHHNVNFNLILMIRDTFNILPFGDSNYKGLKCVGISGSSGV